MKTLSIATSTIGFCACFAVMLTSPDLSQKVTMGFLALINLGIFLHCMKDGEK